MAAVPSDGRASRIEARVAPEAEATRALYERYANQIFGYCLHQLGSREEAEDAVQSTFLNAFRGLSRGVVPEAESAWLFKIAHNVCLSRRRSSWRRGRVESPADFELVQEHAPAPSRRADELIGLQDVLEQMPENQRRAILLREWQGLSYREIAEEIELSQAAVETLIFRARRSLAQGLAAPPAEQRSWRARVRSSLDVGTLVGALKSLLGPLGAAKLAGTAAVVATSTVAIPVAHELKPRHLAPKQAPAAHVRHEAASSAAGGSAHAVVVTGVSRPVAAKPARRTAHRPRPLQPKTLALASVAAAPESVEAAAPPATPVASEPPAAPPPALPPSPPASDPAPAPASASAAPSPEPALAAAPARKPEQSRDARPDRSQASSGSSSSRHERGGGVPGRHERSGGRGDERNAGPAAGHGREVPPSMVAGPLAPSTPSAPQTQPGKSSPTDPASAAATESEQPDEAGARWWPNGRSDGRPGRSSGRPFQGHEHDAAAPSAPPTTTASPQPAAPTATVTTTPAPAPVQPQPAQPAPSVDRGHGQHWGWGH